MQAYRTFKTKTGYCHVTSDMIILCKEKGITELPKETNTKSVAYVLVVYALLGVAMLFFASTYFMNDQLVYALLFALMGFYVLFGTATSINNSTNKVLRRGTIQNVSYKKAIIGIRRAYFEVYFENEEKKVKRRVIMLPGSLFGANVEVKRAVQIMQGEDYLNK